MDLYAPDYYKSFSCIAGKCKHSCCIGWEIDIDEKTLNFYKSIEGELGSRLKSGISDNGERAHFTLDNEERCPFLNKDNLCDIIIGLGEDKLCGICRDHPRFRNFFGDRTEIGLGLCCEAAAELIINNKQRVEIVEIANDRAECEFYEEDEVFFGIRKKVFDILQNRDASFDSRIKRLMSEFELDFPEKTHREWADVFLGLEHLESAWVDKLNNLKKAESVPQTAADSDMEFEQLSVYFIYRHLADSIFDGRLKERLYFILISLHIINLLRQINEGDGILEIARMYSAEIEYSEENIEALLKITESSRD